MNVHYLDPEDEPRECPGCFACCPCEHHQFAGPREPCNGTGQLGNPEGPKVEIQETFPGVFRYRLPIQGDAWRNSYPTPEAALKDARKTWRK